jgi:hypothetical protein
MALDQKYGIGHGEGGALSEIEGFKGLTKGIGNVQLINLLSNPS